MPLVQTNTVHPSQHRRLASPVSLGDETASSIQYTHATRGALCSPSSPSSHPCGEGFTRSSLSSHSLQHVPHRSLAKACATKKAPCTCCGLSSDQRATGIYLWAAHPPTSLPCPCADLRSTWQHLVASPLARVVLLLDRHRDLLGDPALRHHGNEPREGWHKHHKQGPAFENRFLSGRFRSGGWGWSLFDEGSVPAS